MFGLTANFLANAAPTELKEFMKGRCSYKYGAPLELNLMSGRASVKFRVSRQNAR